ncbi:NifU family protein [Nocardia shimofusensis]|uniref:NifU family protein n=1 Tax=Nocardia shimofusensis TaxID=228596 RepID=UPI00082DF07C|nr:NifU family protein [Nocardia shimofusensis]
MDVRPAEQADANPGESRWRTAGDRIETLLEASSAGGAVARERAEQLVREVVDLYGAGLARVVELMDTGMLERLARDDLVASLLLVHGLHPHDVDTRVRAALDSVRPYLGSHGGDVELVEIAGAVVRLELTGSCRGCPSSSVTLELAVQDAVRAAAPEIEAIEVVAATTAPAAPIPADSLFSRVRSSDAAGHWVPAPELAELVPGEVGGFAVAGAPVLACRVGEHVFAYRDLCPVCAQSLAGAALHRRPGLPVGDAILRCPTCRAHFDVVAAGARIDGDGHLEPIPVLVRDGVLSMAVPVGVHG